MPHKKEHKIRVEDIFWQSPIPETSLLPMAPNIAPGLFDEEFPEPPRIPEKAKKDGSFIDWLIPKAGAAGLMPQEPASLFNTEFITDVEYDPLSYRVPVDPTPARWGADMSGVKFGTALPDRITVEDMILEASGIAGVAPQYTEGLRTKAQNTELGAHKKSKHMMGQAFDLAISGNKERDKRYERELIRLFRPLGFSVILKSDHVHLQTPPPSR